MLVSAHAHGELVWQCASKDIKAALLPAPWRLQFEPKFLP